MKKLISLLLVCLFLLSSATLICSAANESEKVVNVKVTTPKADAFADFSIRISDKNYKANYADVARYESCDYSQGVVSRKEFVDSLRKIDELELDENFETLEFLKNYYYGISFLFEKGISWIECDQSISSLSEYFVNNDLDKITVDKVRFMNPGDKFRTDKNYCCWVGVLPDVSEEIAKLDSLIDSVTPYYIKEKEIRQKLDETNYSDSEYDNINAELEKLKEEYSEQLVALKTAYNDLCKKTVVDYDVTVNGKKTIKNEKSVLFWEYNFGTPEKASFIDIIQSYFNNIIDKIKNMFSFIFNKQ